jgi:hypothetical protein
MPKALSKALAALLLLVGFINFAPIAGVLGADKMAGLYGVPLEGADLAILMRHRAVLLGIVGAFVMASALVREWRSAAIAMGFASMASFVLLAWLEAPHNANIAKVVLADVAASVLLGAAAAIHFFWGRDRGGSGGGGQG